MRDEVKWKGNLRKQRHVQPGETKTSKSMHPSVARQIRGLTELRLAFNKLGPIFSMHMVTALKQDDYIRVLDLRKNKLTSTVVNDTKKIDFMRQIQSNESLTNIDLRANEGFNKSIKYKLSMVMLRNMDRLRSQGVIVQGSWLNKEILTFKEAGVHSDVHSPKSNDPFCELKSGKDEAESIFNIELSNIAASTHLAGKVTNSRDLMGSAY